MADAGATRDAEEVRRSWVLAAPALVLLALGASGPLLIVLAYSFLEPGSYSGVTWRFTTEAWQGILFTRDIFDGTLGWADAHLAILWRSVKLSLLTTALTFLVGLPTAWFIATRPPKARALWLFLITIPFWTNLLIRTFAINEIIRNEGVMNTLLLRAGLIARPIQLIYTDAAVLIGMTYVYLPLMVLPLSRPSTASTCGCWRRATTFTPLASRCCAASCCRSSSPGSSRARSWSSSPRSALMSPPGCSAAART
jgi:spermidine/putrescine transport system permease protein